MAGKGFHPPRGHYKLWKMESEVFQHCFSRISPAWFPECNKLAFDTDLYTETIGYWHLFTFKTESYKRVLIGWPQRLLSSITRNSDYIIIMHIWLDSWVAGIPNTYFIIDVDHISPKIWAQYFKSAKHQNPFVSHCMSSTNCAFMPIHICVICPQDLHFQAIDGSLMSNQSICFDKSLQVSGDSLLLCVCCPFPKDLVTLWHH